MPRASPSMRHRLRIGAVVGQVVDDQRLPAPGGIADEPHDRRHLRVADRRVPPRRLGSFTASTGLSQADGCLLVADALAAFYASAALIVNDTWGRAVLRLP